MDIKLRGWNRDMGTHTIASHDLDGFRISDDPKKTINRSSPGLFRSYGEVSVAWQQTLRFTGDYRMQIDFSQDDIIKLMKASYGRELDVDLLDKGFVVSDALKKKILSEIKWTELTLGDLIGNPQAAPQTGTVRPFRRRAA